MLKPPQYRVCPYNSVLYIRVRRYADLVLQQRKVVIDKKNSLALPKAIQEEVSLVKILKTVTWGEVVEMALGIILIMVFIFDMVFVFGE